MKRPAFMFYPGDWRKDPCLSRCSPATRGVWMDLLCDIHSLDDRGAIAGTIDQLARATGCFPADMATALAELEATGTADVTKSGDVVTVISRRFKREWHERNGAKLRKKKQRGGGDRSAVTDESHENHNPSSSSSSVSSSDQSFSHAREAAARCDIAKLRASWAKHTGQVTVSTDLLALAPLFDEAAPLQSPPVPVDEYADRCIKAFSTWVDGIREGRRPQKSPLKLREHFGRVQEIVAGKRAAVPVEEPPPSGRFSSHDDVRLQPEGLDEVLAKSANGRATEPVAEPRPYGPASAKGARSRTP